MIFYPFSQQLFYLIYFFTEYLPEANGDYIKIYLYVLFLSKYDKDIKVNDLCKKLSLPLKVIQDGMKYWEEQGVLLERIQDIL